MENGPWCIDTLKWGVFAMALFFLFRGNPEDGCGKNHLPAAVFRKNYIPIPFPCLPFFQKGGFFSMAYSSIRVTSYSPVPTPSSSSTSR